MHVMSVCGEGRWQVDWKGNWSLGDIRIYESVYFTITTNMYYKNNFKTLYNNCNSNVERKVIESIKPSLTHLTPKLSSYRNQSPPRWNPPWHSEWAYLAKRFSPQCMNKWSSSEWCGYVRYGQTDLLCANARDLIQYGSIKIRVASLSLVSFRILTV